MRKRDELKEERIIKNRNSNIRATERSVEFFSLQLVCLGYITNQRKTSLFITPHLKRKSLLRIFPTPRGIEMDLEIVVLDISGQRELTKEEIEAIARKNRKYDNRKVKSLSYAIKLNYEGELLSREAVEYQRRLYNHIKRNFFRIGTTLKVHYDDDTWLRSKVQLLHEIRRKT